jgi:hypothetical protein
MKTIPLTQGKVALVDDADFEWLNRWKWQAARGGHTYYAVRTDYSEGRKRKISMHRLIMGAPEGVEIDHQDRDGLNNRRENLRLATRSQSMRNRRTWGSSLFNGVSWIKSKRRWQVQIQHQEVQKYLGSFKCEKVAALAYDFAARELHEGFAKLNFPEYN